MISNIGKMLYTLRKNAGVQQHELCRGILSLTELSRLESGDKEADKFVLEALFQRLGKSLDKLELTVSGEEYRILVLREMILETFRNKKFDGIDAYFEMYEEVCGKDENLQSQYLLQMKGIYCFLAKGDIREGIGELEAALAITFSPEESLNWTECLLCGQEIRNLLLIAYLKIKVEDWSAAEELLIRLEEYLETNYTDEEERAKVYPPCMWLLAKCLLTRGDLAGAYEACETAKACLARNGILALMREILEIESVCLEKMGRSEERTLALHQIQALDDLYAIAETARPEDEILLLLMTSSQEELIISNEMVKELRLAQNLTQDELSADICARETLSRIESGKQSPHRKNIYKMFRRMGLDRERYYGFVCSDDYEVYEKVRECNRAFFQKEKDVAQILIEELKKVLDLSIPMNKQYIARAELNQKILRGQITSEQTLEELKTILCYTLTGFEGKVYRTPFREECATLNQMALALKHIGRKDEAIDLYRQILDRYHSSMVLGKHHAVPEMLVYTNYACLLEECDKIEEAEKVAKEGMRLCLECQRGDMLPHLEANLSCVYDKRHTAQADVFCKRCLEDSYYLLILFNMIKDSKMIWHVYKSKYNKGLD